MKVLPQSFFESDRFVKVLRDGLSAVIYKEVPETTLQKEGYVSTHAITLVLKGNLNIEHVDRGIASLHAGQMIFVPKGLYMVSDCVLEDEPFVAIVFFFEENLIDEFISSFGKLKIQPRCNSNLIMNYSPEIRAFTENLLALYKDGTHNHHRITRAKLFEFLHLLSMGEKGQQFIETLQCIKTKQKRNLKDFMLANFNKSLNVEDYAYLTGRSLSTFNRDFHRQFNISPKKWLMDQRMEKAYELLSANPRSVTEIASETGYENFSHFIKAFHKRYGISPKQLLIQKRTEVLV